MPHTKPHQEAAGFVTTAWVKSRYSIANSTLYLWIANQRLPAPVKIGARAVRFRLDDILAFEQRLSPTSESPRIPSPPPTASKQSARSDQPVSPANQALCKGTEGQR